MPLVAEVRSTLTISESASRAWSALPKSRASVKRGLAILATLNDLGWQRSVDLRAPVDNEDRPLPWYTYAAILWLGPRLKDSDVVFEYGAGNSTRWYAGQVARVVSVEHDPTWARLAGEAAPPNVSVLHRLCSGDGVFADPTDAYVAAIGEEPDVSFDVVVVDGQARVTCVQAAMHKVRASSLLILDNSDRPQLRPALDALAGVGFQRIDFMGPAPGSGRLSYTSVFARDMTRWLTPQPPLRHLGY